MPSDLYEHMNANKQSSTSQIDPMGETFIGFMKEMRGKNPGQFINHLISSGFINQDQLNIVQQEMQKTMGRFDKFKHLFGF